MACAGLNIILVSMLTVKFLADNAKAKAGRKVIEEDVRRSIHFRSSANFSRPVSCTLSDRSKLLYYLGHAPNADARRGITTRPHHIYPWKTDNLHVISIFVVILMHKSSERVISMLI
jgi:hypothetical protein